MHFFIVKNVYTEWNRATNTLLGPAAPKYLRIWLRHCNPYIIWFKFFYIFNIFYFIIIYHSVYLLFLYICLPTYPYLPISTYLPILTYLLSTYQHITTYFNLPSSTYLTYPYTSPYSHQRPRNRYWSFFPLKFLSIHSLRWFFLLANSVSFRIKNVTIQVEDLARVV